MKCLYFEDAPGEHAPFCKLYPGTRYIGKFQDGQVTVLVLFDQDRKILYVPNGYNENEIYKAIEVK